MAMSGTYSDTSPPPAFGSVPGIPRVLRHSTVTSELIPCLAFLPLEAGESKAERLEASLNGWQIDLGACCFAECFEVCQYGVLGARILSPKQLWHRGPAAVGAAAGCT